MYLAKQKTKNKENMNRETETSSFEGARGPGQRSHKEPQVVPPFPSRTGGWRSSLKSRRIFGRRNIWEEGGKGEGAACHYAKISVHDPP